MTVIETKGEIDDKGLLKLKHPLKIQNKEVRVVIQVLGDADREESETNNKKERLETFSKKGENEEENDFGHQEIDDFELEDENEDSYSNF